MKGATSSFPGADGVGREQRHSEPRPPIHPRLLVPFSHLSTLWIQVTGTWCNLQCLHCINASGPKDPWLKSLDTETVKRYITEAESSGVKEIYFTGGEP